MEHTRQFILDNSYETNKRIPDDMRFYHRMQAVQKRVLETIRRIRSAEEVTKQDYEQLHRYIRAKLGQGKQWSTGLLLSLLKDAEEFIQEQEAALERMREEEE